MPFCKTLPISERVKLNPHYCVVKVRDPELAEQCRPGMFFELKADLRSQDKRLYKPVSIYEVNDADIAFLIKIVGPGTQALCGSKTMDSIKLVGPLGNGFPLCENKNILMVSGGVGYPPLAYLKNVLSASNQVIFLHGGADLEHEFPCDRFYTLDGSSGCKGYVTQDVADIMHREVIDCVYSCGPIPMLKALAAIVSPIPHYCSLEAYMACGVGICYGCAVPVGEGYQRVCKEGPVFNAADLRWEEM